MKHQLQQLLVLTLYTVKTSISQAMVQLSETTFIRDSNMAYSIEKEIVNQIEVMKSKFIAYLIPLKNEEDFKPLLANLRKEHKKARHIVYAYRVGVKSKSCDDGEPKGTAGHPLLELLYKKDLTDVALLVVRYFGGTKLGAGRLLRTYLQAGINAVDSCTLINLER